MSIDMYDDFISREEAFETEYFNFIEAEREVEEYNVWFYYTRENEEREKQEFEVLYFSDKAKSHQNNDDLVA